MASLIGPTRCGIDGTSVTPAFAQSFSPCHGDTVRIRPARRDNVHLIRAIRVAYRLRSWNTLVEESVVDEDHAVRG